MIETVIGAAAVITTSWLAWIISTTHFCEVIWQKLLDRIDEDPVILWVYGHSILTIFTYWLASLIFTILERTKKPSALIRLRLQPAINSKLETEVLFKIILLVLINQILVSTTVFYGIYKVIEWRGYPSFRKLPIFYDITVELAIIVIVEEIGYYYAHRFLHWKYLFTHIHKKHHEWTAPTAIIAQYIHPIENVIVMVPLYSGIVIMSSHVMTSYLWCFLSTIVSVQSHSGYCFPFLPSSEFHDLHHLKCNKNFGVLGILDHLHGTYLHEVRRH